MGVSILSVIEIFSFITLQIISGFKLWQKKAPEIIENYESPGFIELFKLKFFCD